MKKKLHTRVLTALALSLVFACVARATAQTTTRKQTQTQTQTQTPARTQTAQPAPTTRTTQAVRPVTASVAAKENCSPWPAVVNAAYLQVLERPAHGDAVKEATEKLTRGESSVRELVTRLALSDEYKERFVTSRSPEEVAHLLYRHLLARDAQEQELRSATASSASKGFDAVARSLVEGEEYGRRFGSSQIPGALAAMSPCRFPLKLKQHDEFGDGREMTTELSVEADGQFHATTIVKGPKGGQSFCGKVGLWLLDAGGRVVGITGPPGEAQWCAGGTEPDAVGEHAEQWEGRLPSRAFDATGFAALLQRAAGSEPQSATRENSERAARIKQVVR